LKVQNISILFNLSLVEILVYSNASKCCTAILKNVYDLPVREIFTGKKRYIAKWTCV